MCIFQLSGFEWVHFQKVSRVLLYCIYQNNECQLAKNTKNGAKMAKIRGRMAEVPPTL